MAADLDELLDCPIEVGGFELLEFMAAGRPHYLAICGRGYFDRAQLVVDIKAFVDQSTALFGGVPYESFTFIVHLAPAPRGAWSTATRPRSRPARTSSTRARATTACSSCCATSTSTSGT